MLSSCPGHCVHAHRSSAAALPGKRKTKGVGGDPRVAMSVTDMANPYRMAAIQLGFVHNPT